MSALLSILNSSLGKKYIMALSGLVLSGFVLGHALGNTQVFLDPFWINSYGHHLQSLPYGLLWVIRAFLLFCIVAHIWAGVTLTAQNKKARPEKYKKNVTVQASLASRTMVISGVIVGIFLVFHLMHYTIRNVPGHTYNEAIVASDGTEYPVDVELVHNGEHLIGHDGEPLEVHNINDMIVAGFSYPLISILYLVGTFLLCQHLSHGVSSMFQSVGLRNETWRKRLNVIANIYGYGTFLIYASIPLGVWFDIIQASTSL